MQKLKRAVGNLEFPSKKEVYDLNERMSELEKLMNGVRSNMNLLENKMKLARGNTLTSI